MPDAHKQILDPGLHPTGSAVSIEKEIASRPRSSPHKYYPQVKSIKYFIMCLALLSAGVAPATTIKYTAIGSSSRGETQNASATFVSGAGTIDITLNDLISNPRSIGQNISQLFFTLSNGVTVGSLTSSSGPEVTVNGNKTYSMGSTVPTNWSLTSSGSSLLLEVLNTHEAPKHTIIGSPDGRTYSNANASIAGNGPHNAFLESGVTFDLSISGVTAQTTVTSATFGFGTAPGDSLPGTVAAPEPDVVTLVLLAAALAGVSSWATRFRKRPSSKPDLV